VTASLRTEGEVSAGRRSRLPDLMLVLRYWAARTAVPVRSSARLVAAGWRLLARATTAVIMLLPPLLRAIGASPARPGPGEPAPAPVPQPAPSAQARPARVTETASGLRITDKRSTASAQVGTVPAPPATAVASPQQPSTTAALRYV
jgi:hypothetical protein